MTTSKSTSRAGISSFPRGPGGVSARASELANAQRRSRDEHARASSEEDRVGLQPAHEYRGELRSAQVRLRSYDDDGDSRGENHWRSGSLRAPVSPRVEGTRAFTTSSPYRYRCRGHSLRTSGGDMGTAEQDQPATVDVESASRKKPWFRRTWVVGVGALLLGILIGSASAGGTDDPTGTTADRGSAEPAPTVTVTETVAAEPDTQALEELEARAAELDEREAAIAEREQAQTEVEQQAAANTVPDGSHIIGTDIEPGRYRTTADVTDLCYVSLTDESGNLEDNDLWDTGRPVFNVPNNPGWVFESADCGTWQKLD